MTDFEREEMELKELMGDKFVDATQEPTNKPVSKNQSNPVKKVHPMDIPVEDQWQPEKPAPGFFDTLKRTAKDTCLYATLSMVLFWWQQTGRLEETTAWYALIVCTGMAFFNAGKNFRGWWE